jgi:hypothetical protein
MTDLQLLATKDDIATVIHQLFIATDQRDWSAVRACFADAVDFDMTSLAGGAPVALSPVQITDAWDAGLKPIQHVHHQVGNLQVTVHGDTATAFCYGIALHYRPTADGNNVRRFVGSYDFTLRRIGSGWVISAFRFNAKFVDGNLALDSAPQG